MEEYSADERERVPGGRGEPKVEYAAMLLGATGNVGGHILHLLVQSPLCKRVVVVTLRNVAELANAVGFQNLGTLFGRLFQHQSPI
jgi:hypothetical protein